MDVKKLQQFCRDLPGATEDIKWENDLVFSVGKKMFAAFDVDRGLPLGFKCSDDDFDRLTSLPGIIPAPYAARFSWVSVRERDALSQAQARDLIRASYQLVLGALPKRTRDSIGASAAASSKRAPGRARSKSQKS